MQSQHRTLAFGVLIGFAVLGVGVDRVSAQTTDPRIGTWKLNVAKSTYSPDWMDAGGLMSYGPSSAAMYHRAAIYVDRILKGAKPADLPSNNPCSTTARPILLPALRPSSTRL